MSYLKKFYNGLSIELQAIMFMLLACFLFSLLNVCIKEVVKTVDPYVMVSYRSLFCIFLFLPFILFSPTRKFSLSKFNKVNLYKGVIDFTSLPLWFLAIMNMNMPEAVSITFTTPLFSALFAMLFLKDKFSKEKVFALLFGFFGAYIVMQPDVGGFNKYSLFALGACTLWAAGNVMTKNLTSKQDPISIAFYLNAIVFPLSLPYLLQHWVLLSGKEMLWLLAMAVISNSANLCIATAYTKTRMSTLLTFDYNRLIFSSLLAYFIYGELIEISTIIGSALILASAIFIATRKYAKTSKDVVNEVSAKVETN